MEEAISVQSPRRPRGRPPCGCVWMKGCYVNLASGEPHCAEDARERFVQHRRRYDRARYWDPKKNVRKQRLARSTRRSGRMPKPIQATLDELMTRGPMPHQTAGIPERASPGHSASSDLPCALAADSHSTLACCPHVQHLQGVVDATIKIPRII